MNTPRSHAHSCVHEEIPEKSREDEEKYIDILNPGNLPRAQLLQTLSTSYQHFFQAENSKITNYHPLLVDDDENPTMSPKSLNNKNTNKNENNNPLEKSNNPLDTNSKAFSSSTPELAQETQASLQLLGGAFKMNGKEEAAVSNLAQSSSPVPFYSLKHVLLAGVGSINCVRSLAYKLFLGVLPHNIPTTEWVELMNKQRKIYDDLLKKHLVDPNRVVEDDLTQNNPLSPHEDTTWGTFWKKEELEKEIAKDVERTFPEYPYFASPRVSQIMMRALFIYACENPKTRYKQGMHELLAPFILIADRESIKKGEESQV